MLKIKDLLKDLIKTQNEMNKNLEKLCETKENDEIKLNSCQITLNGISNAIETNIYTKEATENLIKKEIEYDKELTKIKEECPELLEFIEEISTNYANMNKYEILDTTKMFSKKYKIEKIEERN